MDPIRYTLIGDGPFERALLAVLDWLLMGFPEVKRRGVTPRFADPREIACQPPRKELGERARKAAASFPCDLLFIHRDAEAEPRQRRVGEIRQQIEHLELPPSVPVVPVRMTEAWLLIDEQAIRSAADNPNGKMDLELPPTRRLESTPDPKKMLHRALIDASEKTGRREKQFRRDLSSRASRVAELIDDFSELRHLSAFVELEEATRRALDSLDLEPPPTSASEVPR